MAAKPPNGHNIFYISYIIRYSSYSNWFFISNKQNDSEVWKVIYMHPLV